MLFINEAVQTAINTQKSTLTAFGYTFIRMGYREDFKPSSGMEITGYKNLET